MNYVVVYKILYQTMHLDLYIITHLQLNTLTYETPPILELSRSSQPHKNLIYYAPHIYYALGGFTSISFQMTSKKM